MVVLLGFFDIAECKSLLPQKSIGNCCCRSFLYGMILQQIYNISYLSHAESTPYFVILGIKIRFAVYITIISHQEECSMAISIFFIPTEYKLDPAFGTDLESTTSCSRFFYEYLLIYKFSTVIDFS